MYFLQYPTTVPHDSGENDDFYALTHVRPPPCDYKRRRQASLRRALVILVSLASLSENAQDYRAHISTDSTSSRDLGAFFPLLPRLYPLLQALRVQDNTVPSHTPFAGRMAPRPEPG